MTAPALKFITLNAAPDINASLTELFAILNLPVGVSDGRNLMIGDHVDKLLISEEVCGCILFNDLHLKNRTNKVGLDKILNTINNYGPSIPIIFLSEHITEPVKPSAKRNALINRAKHELEFVNVVDVKNDAPVAPNIVAEILHLLTVSGVIGDEAHYQLYAVKRQLGMLMYRGQWDQALPIAEKAHADYPNDVRISLMLAKIFWSMQKVQEAQDIVDNLLKKGFRTLPVLALGAAIHRKIDDRKTASSLLERALKICADNVAILVATGDLKLDEGAYADAKKRYAQALSIDPDNDMALAGNLATEILGGELSPKQLLRGDKGMDELGRLLNLKAIDLVSNAVFPKAKKLYESVLAIAEDNNEWNYKILFNLFLLEKKRRDKIEAIRYYQRCRKIAPPGRGRLDEYLPYILKAVKETGMTL